MSSIIIAFLSICLSTTLIYVGTAQRWKTGLLVFLMVGVFYGINFTILGSLHGDFYTVFGILSPLLIGILFSIYEYVLSNPKQWCYCLFLGMSVTFFFVETNYFVMTFMVSVLHLSSTILMSSFLTLVASVLHLVLMKVLKIDVSILSQNDDNIHELVLIPCGKFLLIALLLSFFVRVNNSYHWWTGRDVSILLTLIPYFLYILYLYMMAHHLQMYQDKKDYEELQKYVQEVEDTLSTTRGFKHDFSNLVISFKTSIQENDVKEVRRMYQDILEEAHIEMMDHSKSIIGIANIDERSIQSILIHKKMEAEKKDVDFSVVFATKFSFGGMKLIDFLRVLANLIDNAIQAAELSEEKKVRVEFFENNHYKKITLQNTAQPSVGPRMRIRRENFRMKQNHGIGLNTVRKIIRKYHNVEMIIEEEENQVSQVLMIQNQ